MSSGDERPQLIPQIIDIPPAMREPEHCVLAIPGPVPERRVSIDGVRMRLEPGWSILKHDDMNASIRNENDEERFEFTIQLRRINLSAIAPADFLRLDILLNEHHPEWKNPVSCDSISSGLSRRDCHRCPLR